MKIIQKAIVILIKKFDIGSAIAIRLVKITGKSKEPIHPKHFLTQKPWFIKYIKRKDIVLDLGCGSGQNSLKAAKIAKKVIGVDHEDNLLKSASNEATARNMKNIRFQIIDLENKLSYPDNSFDEIIFLDVLEHLHNRSQILHEIKRVLKPKGFLFLSVPNSQTSWKKLQRKVKVSSFSDPDHKIEYSEKQIRKLLEMNRFLITNFGYGKYDTPLRGVFDIIGAFSIATYKSISKWRQSRALTNPIEASGFEITSINIK